MSYKESANRAFVDGEYSKAINFFTLAIKLEPGNSLLYSSRAKAYYFNTKDLPSATSQQWKKVSDDCHKALHFDKKNYDAIYYNALFVLNGLGDHNRALKLMEEAYAKSLDNAKTSKKYSLPQEIYLQILKVKSSSRKQEEDDRIARSHPLFESLIELLQKQYHEELVELNKKVTDRTNQDYHISRLSLKYSSDIKDLIKIFSNSYNHASNLQQIEAPDYLCDPISFELFHDPVITPSGHSYEKAWLWNHLASHDYDPLTRQKLTLEQCYSNLSLKLCVEDYLKENGKSLYV